MRNIAKEWHNLRQAKKMLNNIKQEMAELDRLMVIAQQEVCQPKHAC